MTYRQLEEYPKYEVNEFGQVRNIKSGKLLKPNKINGYLYVCLYSAEEKKRKLVFVHRLVGSVFLGITTKLKKDVPLSGQYVIDHIDGNKENNNLCNLRIANRSDNIHCSPNRKSKSSTGFIGVSSSYGKSPKPWRARISQFKKQKHLGYFNTKLEASEAYKKASLLLYGEFSNQNLD